MVPAPSGLTGAGPATARNVAVARAGAGAPGRGNAASVPPADWHGQPIAPAMARIPGSVRSQARGNGGDDGTGHAVVPQQAAEQPDIGVVRGAQANVDAAQAAR